MQMPPKRKPTASGKTAGFQKIEMQDSKIDGLEDSPNTLNLQAIRLRNRFVLSWPLARAVAELHFGRAA